MNKLTKLNPATCAKTIAHLNTLPAPRGHVVFKGHAYELEHCQGVVSAWQIGYGQPFDNTWTDDTFGFNRQTDCVANYSGPVEVNDVTLQVISTSTFNGVLHYGIFGADHGNNVLGWVPACLCNIPDAK